MDLSGNMVRQMEQDMPVDDDGGHVANVGRLIEDMELKMRNLLQEVYFGKAKDVVASKRHTFSRQESPSSELRQKPISLFWLPILVSARSH